MKKRALRWVLGLGYVILLTALLLYQAGAFGGRREWEIAVLGTLFLGVALMVVLLLYIRVNDQIRKQEEKGSGGEEVTVEKYDYFLAIMEGSALSERELEVAWLLYRGYTNRQIGEELYIAETTVKKHVSHIYEKLHVGSRKEFRAYVQATGVAAPCQTDPHG